ncbi:O-antigen ligase family protein [Zobellia russellii]|uniref:O-antigen ligase family protein n=1 Tax=Zobellia russellii TaxID=248907 RepID=UPI001BFF09FB|nr:O-antigen ligase family protein [Zobellia russellii]MBT9186741.1 O-antigen ligase family protein [Zobellia russellii]
MSNYEQHFNWTGVQIHHYYIYFVIAGLIASYLTYKSDSKYKLEGFLLSFYFLTGNINDLLTIKIPGFSFFEIQPIRLIYLLLLFFIVRTTLLSKEKIPPSDNFRIPYFIIPLVLYILLQIISISVNLDDVGLPEALKTILESVAFVIILVGLRLMADQATYDLVGKSIIVGGVITSLVAFIQLGYDPYFLRIGDERLAFGNVLRSNGLFTAEYYNSYFLIIAITWTLTTVKKNFLKVFLVVLFSLGVITSFMRMSWIILIVVLATYLIFINKVALEKLLFAALSGLMIILSLSIFYYQDIMNSSLVKERLSDSVGGRKGYYTMVLDNIDQKPWLGFGGLTNDVYYVNLLRITQDRDRATATTGSLHSGYFSSMFEYGIPASVCFTLFIILSAVYYSTSFKKNLYFVIPFLVSIIFMVGNLTNTFMFLSYLSVLYAVHIGMGMGIRKIESNN